MANLLEEASILLTPTAYNNGSMLAVKPSEDLLGPELVANGDFSTDSVWAKDANWSIANGKATSTGGGRMFQSIPFLETNIGSKVVVSFDIVDYTSGGVVIQCYGDSSETFTGVGTHTFETVTTNTLNFYINNSGQGNLVGSIDNVSVKVDLSGDFIFTRNSAATRVNAQGLIENVQILSSDLVSNGNFSQEGSEEILNGNFVNDSDWILGTGVIIADNKLTKYDPSVGNTSASQSGVFTIGKTYKYKLVVSGDLTASDKVVSFFTDFTSAGTYEGYWTANSTSLVFSLRGSTNVYSIDSVSVKEVGQDWDLGTGWSIGDNKAIQDNSTPNTGDLTQSNAFVVGKTYKIQVDADVTSGTVSVIAGGHNLINSSGTYTFYKTATSTTITFRNYSNFIGSVTNISVVEITDDTNLPRIDYTDGCGSWLLEPQSTNLITNSEDFSNISWVKGRSIISSNVNTSPDGKLNADKFIGSSVIGDKKLVDSISVVSGNKYTLSVFAKKGEFNGICLRHNTVAFPSGNVIFNLDTGLGTVSGVIDSFSSKDYGNGWWKLSITSTSDATNSCGQELLLVNDGAFVTNGNDVDGIYIWGAQSEQQSFATSYIPTSGAISTRLRDLSGNSGNTGLINSTEGVLYVDFAAYSTQNTREITLSDGTGNNRIIISYNANNRLDVNLYTSGGYQAIFNYTGISDSTAFNKIAFKYKENDCSLWVNGVEVGVDTNAPIMPIGLDILNLASSNGATNIMYGKVNAVAVFKTALTDEQLTALTTI